VRSRAVQGTARSREMQEGFVQRDKGVIRSVVFHGICPFLESLEQGYSTGVQEVRKWEVGFLG